MNNNFLSFYEFKTDANNYLYYDSVFEAKEEINELKAYNIFKKNCTWYTDATSKIYRGAKSSGDFIIMDSSDLVREKYYLKKKYTTLLISESESWKDFPARSESIIATTSHDTAATYGNVYITLPYSDTNLCITPKQTLDYCFKKTILSKYKFSIFKELDMLLEKLFVLMDDKMSVEDMTTENFYKRLNRLQDKKFQQDVLSSETTDESIMTFFDEINQWNGSVKEYFSNALEPRSNGFIQTKINSQLEIRGAKELWFKGKALLVKESVFNKFIETAKESIKMIDNKLEKEKDLEKERAKKLAKEHRKKEREQQRKKQKQIEKDKAKGIKTPDAGIAGSSPSPSPGASPTTPGTTPGATSPPAGTTPPTGSTTPPGV